MRKLVIVGLLLISCRVFAQWDDDNRILNRFIVMIKPGHSIGQLLKDEPSLSTNRVLSQRMNIWLVNRNSTAAAEEFLDKFRKNEHIKIAQFDHHVQQRTLIPNDPDFNQQWNMLNTGQNT